MVCSERLATRGRGGEVANGRGRVTEKESELSAVVGWDNWEPVRDEPDEGRRDQRWFLMRISIATQIHLASSRVGSQAKRPSHKRRASGIPNSRVKRRRSQRLRAQSEPRDGRCRKCTHIPYIWASIPDACRCLHKSGSTLFR